MWSKWEVTSIKNLLPFKYSDRLEMKFVTIFFLVIGCSLASEDQVLLVKEYFKEGMSESVYLSDVRNSVVTRKVCEELGSIWKFDNGRFFTMSGNLVYILNSECQKLDSLRFPYAVIDFTVKSNVLIASVSDDEVEYYQSKVFLVNLDDGRPLLLSIPEAGVKFGLNLADDENTLAFVHQNVLNTVQEIKLYSLQTKQLATIQNVNLASVSLGMISYPARSVWVGNFFYFGLHATGHGPWTLMSYDRNTKAMRKVMEVDSDCGVVFRITRNQKGIVLFKREGARVKRVVLIDIETRKVKVLFECGDSSLSDLDDFVYLD